MGSGGNKANKEAIRLQREQMLAQQEAQTQSQSRKELLGSQAATRLANFNRANAVNTATTGGSDGLLTTDVLTDQMQNQLLEQLFKNKGGI